MKILGRKIIAIVLALVIWTAGTGFVMSKMVCLGSGKVSYQMGEAVDCCNKTGEPVLIKDSCCEITNKAVEVDHFLSSGINISLKQPVALVPQLFSITPVLITQIISPNDESPEAPPILPERIFLLLSVIRI